MRAQTHSPWRPGAGRLVLVGAVLLSLFFTRADYLRESDFAAPFNFFDMQAHLIRLDIYDKVSRLDPTPQSRHFVQQFQPLYRPDFKWPPGVYAVAGPVMAALGPQSRRAVQLVNLLFTLVLLVGVIGLGRALGSWEVGLWAGLLTVLFSPIVAASWYFSLDLPLCAMVAVGLLLLWHTRRLSRPGLCLAFGLWSAAGLLVKMSYGLFLLGPGLWALVGGLRPPGQRRQTLLGAGLALLGLLAVLPLMARYLPLAEFWPELSNHLFSTALPGAQFVERWGPGALLFYPVTALINCLPLVLAGVPLVLLHLSWGRPVPGRGFWLATLWGAIVVLVAMASKLERYALPLYPLLLLLTVYWVHRTTAARPRLRQVLLVLLALTHLGEVAIQREEPLAHWVAVHERYEEQPGALGWLARLKVWSIIEMRMPGAGELDLLDQRIYDPGLDFRPLARTAAALLRAEPGPRRVPLGLLVEPGTTLERHSAGGERLMGLLFGEQRGRILYPAADASEARHFDTLLVAHSPGRGPDLTALQRRYRALGSRTVVVGQTQVRGELALTLLRAEEPPPVKPPDPDDPG